MFSLRLLTLECLQAQETGGDELYIVFDGKQIWSITASGLKMRERPDHDDFASTFNFVTGQYLGRDGWQSATDYQANQNVIASEGVKALELWEADNFLRGSDDYLGKTPISEADIDRGEISVLFEKDGARYRLTYQVTV